MARALLSRCSDSIFPSSLLCASMLRVFKASGEEVLATELAEFTKMIRRDGQHVRPVRGQPVRGFHLKRHLQELCGLARFRQRLLEPNGSILSDDATLHGPVDLQLILLPFTPSSQEQVQELCQAARRNDTQTLARLLQRPQDPNLLWKRSAPLYSAANCNSLDAARLLLEAKADKEWVSHRGITPLQVASLCGHIEVVGLLLEAKAEKDRADLEGRTPMLLAARSDHGEVVRLLLEAKADKDKASSLGATPMSVAIARGSQEVLRVLLDGNEEALQVLLDGAGRPLKKRRTA
ncbi:ANKRD50 [Symbiodinium natans]|uniref:ANKRD50 protein n=1 Tax=Symbiodinium natans TaxID=878477 RepID=A0A812RIM9_9DINO|nr:ANKRD50 [Symbiodinium natans]